MALVSEIEAVARAGSVQRCRTIDEKYGVVNVVFLMEIREECVSDTVRSRRFKLRVQ